jgi:hypothetical protein
MLLVTGCLVLLGAIAAGWYVVYSQLETGGAAGPRSSPSPEPKVRDGEDEVELTKLPETSPPSDLPIIPWGRRDHFPVIRKPRFISAEEGKQLLAVDEPVLGIVMGGRARAYSTNQLNNHEMVIDTLAGTPILVTY